MFAAMLASLRRSLPSWLQSALLLVTISSVSAQPNACGQQICFNGGSCHPASLAPGYICNCVGDWNDRNCNVRFPGTSATIPKQCGQNFIAESGTVQTPNYPLPSSHNEDCFYLIRIPSALSITLHFDVFITESQKDELYIIPGAVVDFTLPNIREYNGTIQMRTEVFETNQLVLNWITDFNINSPGFSIRYEANPDPCWVLPCSNGGTCTVFGTNFNCECPPDFSGITCQIGTVIISETTVTVTTGDPVIEGRTNHALNFDLSFFPGTTSFSLEGTSLWMVSLYFRDNNGNRVGTQSIFLSGQQGSVAWLPPVQSTIRNLQATVNLNALSCNQLRLVCATIDRSFNPSPLFDIRGTPTDDALLGCTPVTCRGVEVTSIMFSSPLRTLREGTNAQSVQFDLTVFTNIQAGRVTGQNLWKIILFASADANGLGSTVLQRQLSLTQSQASAGVSAQTGDVRFLGLQATLNLVGFVCSQTRYLCVRLEKGDSPTPDYTLTGSPSDSVLTTCRAVDCRGVQVTETTVSVTSGTPLIERQANQVNFRLSIQSDSTGGSVSGQNLFTVRTFGSNSLTGTSIRISEQQTPGNVGIVAGRLATISGLSTSVNLNSQLCQQVVAFCTELGKSFLASPDFTLEAAPNSDALRDCVDVECRGVYIQSLDLSLTSSSSLLYGNRNQELAFSLRVQTASPSASILGSNLWRLFVYTNSQLDGMGTRRSQVAVPLTGSQLSTALGPGQQANFNNLQVTLDLSSITSCADITYLCVELQKGFNPSPDFTLQGSTIRCMLVQCRMFNPCGATPCRNGGACTNGNGGTFTCSCTTGWMGELCSNPMNACSRVSCLNGGTCIDRQFLHECNCQLGWTGNLCQLVDSGVLVTSTTLTVTSGVVRENSAQNNLLLQVVLQNSPTGSTLSSGNGYWQVQFFTSLQANGSGQRTNQQSVNVGPDQAGLGIRQGGTLSLGPLAVNLNLQGESCGRAPYVCVEVRKGSNPSPDFLLSGSLIACRQSNCGGVQVIQVTGTVNNGQTLVIGGSSYAVNMDVVIQSSASGASVSGFSLWSLVLFTNTVPTGLGSTLLQSTAFLTSQVASTDLVAGTAAMLRGATANFDPSGLSSCQQVQYLCVRVERNPLSSTDYTLVGVPDDTVLTNCQPLLCRELACTSNLCRNGATCQELPNNNYLCQCANGWTGDFCGERVNACTNIACANGGTCIDNQFSYVCRCLIEWQGTDCTVANLGVIVRNVQILILNVLVLREGTAANDFVFSVVISSAPNGQSVSGANLWRFTVFGSSRSDGGGVRYAATGALYSQSAGLVAGGSLTVDGIRATLDYSRVLCSEADYVCVEVSPGVAASPPFVVTGSRVACVPVTCVGIQITNTVLQVIPASAGIKERNSNNPLTLDLTLTSSLGSGSVAGSRLWRITSFLSRQPDGSGMMYAATSVQLSDSQAGVGLVAGQTATISALQTNADTASDGLLCGQFSFVCVRLEKNSNPSVDFLLGDGSQSYVACAPVTCIGVEITGVIATIVSGEPLATETANNVLILNIRVSSNPGGASVSGLNLWQVIVFADTQLDGNGVPVIQLQANLPGNVASTFLQAGVDLVLRSAQVSLDLRQISCNQIPYICVRLLRGLNPTPDFTLNTDPGDEVLVHCQEIQCEDPSACENNQCANGATCIPLGPGSYRCNCAPGWDGLLCDVVTNYCLVNLNPCLNGGVCTSILDSFQCSCQLTWVGDLCEIANPCLPTNPCNNGGTCFTNNNGVYACSCANGFSGDNCQIAPDPCISTPCLFGGVCSLVSSTAYQCQCSIGFVGTNCGITLDPCDSTPCQNGGICSRVGTSFLYQCRCLTQAFTGPNCDVASACNSNPCQNSGTCTQVGSDYQCQCRVGYSGPQCRTLLNPCASNPCLSGGTCQWFGQEFAYQCRCLQDFTGTNCDVIIAPCSSSPCLNGATCRQLGTDFTCLCAPGYMGSNCNTIQNPCLNSPCLNGAVCQWTGQVLIYQCQCTQLFTGINCETSLNPCVSTPCLNGATCRQLGTDFSCQCAPGYMGSNCNTIQNPCLNSPCLNGAVCQWTGQVLIYQCQCTQLFTGINCETSLNPCVSTPCLNGATCRQLGTDFSCQCAPGYTGTNCNAVQNPCNNNPCINGGFCQWSGQVLIYQCQCQQGFEGNNCQVAQNPCDNNPCGNGGSCVWLLPRFAFQCQCLQMYTGNNCELSLGVCFSSPCLNGGACQNRPGNTYSCSCPASNKGPRCQYNEPCFPTPCLNSGGCSSDAFGNFYTCSCFANFQGNNCQYPNPCSPQPCQNNAQCIPDSVGSSYQCNCGFAYLGTNCQFPNPCTSSLCFNGGRCEPDGTGSMFTCICQTGFVGSQCQVADVCLGRPCLNAAICSLVTGGLGYVCSCSNGFFGDNCQIPDPCNLLPCGNRGQCITTNGGLDYVCNCQAQYLGTNCQNLNPCFGLICLNEGICETNFQGTGFTCACLPEYQGNRCQDRNPCASNPCLNQGSCQLGTGGNSYFCVCQPQFLGSRCENRDPCLANPCLSGGSCTSAAQGLLYECACLPQYFGTNCENVDPCISDPCQNGGVCNPLSSGFTCMCAPAYTGTFCSILDPCGSTPCLNGGVCLRSTGPSGFFCQCFGDYIGETCQIRDPCSSNPCLNGGSCVPNVAVMLFTCLCSSGYIGNNCEIGPRCFSTNDFRCSNGAGCVSSLRQCDGAFDCSDGSDENGCPPRCTNQEFRCNDGTCINIRLVCNGIFECFDGLDENNCPSPCDPSPCHVEATCVNSGTSFICMCSEGFTGVTCNQLLVITNNPPSFINTEISITINENTLPGIELDPLLQANDPENDELVFGLVDNVAQELFIVISKGPTSARLTLRKELDREIQGSYNFVVSVSDGVNEVLHSGVLELLDFNDNPPTFTNLPGMASVFENADLGFEVFDVNATDPDQLAGGYVRYSFVENSMPSPFVINLYDGKVTVFGFLDYETTQVYNLVVKAEDSAGDNSLSTTASLTVQVIDVQDTGPIFVNTPYNRTIVEGLALNTVVVTVTAMDQDTVNANGVEYSIIAGNLGSFFSLDMTTGAISLVRELDRENPQTPANFTLVVRALETGANAGTFVFNTFTITINDVDDEPPRFNQSVYSVSVSEQELPGFVLPVGISVNDGEVMIQGTFTIVLADNILYPFSVSPSTAVDQARVTLTLTRPLDYESAQSYTLRLIATDKQDAVSAEVIVTVTDANDNDPRFTHGTLVIALEEGAPPVTPVTTVTVTDADQGINAETLFSIIGGNQANLFEIDPSTGVITTRTSIDFENSARTYTLIVEARNTQPAVAPADGVSLVTVVVTITDINDSPPIFQQPNYYIPIIELSDAGMTIGRVIADDADSGAAGQVTYTILSGNDDATFEIDFNNGNIVLLQTLDRENVAMYNLTIRAQDNAAPALSTTTYLVVEVRDFNDNDPQWSKLQYSASVVEGQPADTFVVQVEATDVDLGLNAQLTYFFESPSEFLYINQTSGQIFTREPLNRERTQVIEVNVIVQDRGTPRRSSNQFAVVTVEVLDINDTPPVFTGTPYVFSIAENQPVQTFVGELPVFDPDRVGTLAYSFTSPQSQFTIDPADGRITTLNSLDREQRDRYDVEVRVTDGTFTTTADVVIDVTDVNDNMPVFSRPMYMQTVVENTDNGAILTLRANDSDIGLNSAIIYQFDLSGMSPIGPFLLNRNTGELFTTTTLDRERQDSYTLFVFARDREGGAGSMSAIATVVVTVTDVNDNRPMFDIQNYDQSVPENVIEGAPIIQVEATDRDIGVNAIIFYRIVQGNENGNFAIEPTTGMITRGATPLDRETRDSYVLTVQAYNEGDLPPRHTTTVTITVLDVNDEIPRFTQDVYLRPDLLETASSGTPVVTVSATDPDLDEGGEILYSITNGNEDSLFVIDSFTGQITVLGSLPDYDVQSSYNLTVTATDQAQPFYSSRATVRVLLVDAQDDPPEFTMARYVVNLTENVGQGFPFLGVEAQVPGKPDSVVTYSLEPNVNPFVLELFELSAVTGVLTTKGPIDYESLQSLYTFTVLAINGGALSGSAAVWVYIEDVNDNVPVFTTYPMSDVTVEENMDGGYIIAPIVAMDADSGLNGNVVYNITAGNQAGLFDIVPEVNGEAFLVSTAALDRETQEIHTITITGSDQGIPNLTSSIVVTIVVSDLNDNPPAFTQDNYTVSIEENVFLNAPIGSITILDFDNPDSNNIQFEIDPISDPEGLFQISAAGEITLTSPLDRETQEYYDLLVTMTDASYSSMFSELTYVYVTVLDQNDNPPVFPDQPPVNVTEGPLSVGGIIVSVAAIDEDRGNNSELVYAIVGGNTDGTFGIYDNGSIYIITELDWESTKMYELMVTATDQAANVDDRRSGTVTVVIDVTDINDNSPRFPLEYTGPFSISENVAGSFVVALQATDPDSGLGGQVMYTITGDFSDLFMVDLGTSELRLKPTVQLDYETITAFNLTIIAQDGGSPSLSGTTTVGIIVISANDNTPRFIDTPYRTSINDTHPVDALVYTVTAIDNDVGPDGNVTYSIFDGNPGQMFRIDALTGDVFVNNPLVNGAYVLVLKASDNPLNSGISREVTETLTIIVDDSTTILPMFPDGGIFMGTVLEHSTAGTFITTISVVNEDAVGDLTYTISGSDAGLFSIKQTGSLEVDGDLDAEIKDLYIFNVSAIDTRGASAVGVIYVTVLNINDNPPQFDQGVFNFTVPESADRGYFIGSVTASDLDNATDTMLRFTIERGSGDKFSIEPTTGDLTVSSLCRGDVCDSTPLDREVQDMYTLTVAVSDQGSPPLSNSGVVYIYVTDVNDFRPFFPASSADVSASVSEDAVVNYTVTTVQAVDMDLNAMLVYSIVSVSAKNIQGSPLASITDIEGWFTIDPATGVITVGEGLDRETAAEVVLGVSVTDAAAADPALGTSDSNSLVTIRITDVNDNAPVFEPPGSTFIYATSQEGLRSETLIIDVNAIDPDDPINGMVTYALTGNLSEYVTINPTTGSISLTKAVDRELYSWLNLTITATDGGVPSLSTSIPINIEITDANDNNPIFNQSDYTATVQENSASGAFVAVVTATDQDLGQFGTVRYTLSGEDDVFTIDSITGEITTLQPLDKETKSVYILTVTATDNPDSTTDKRETAVTVTVTVGDVNEHTPITQPLFPFVVDEGLPASTLVGVIEATDLDDPMQILNFTLVLVEPLDGAVLFYINQTTGEIFTTESLEADNATYGTNFTLNILISDNGQPARTVTTTSTVLIGDTNDNDPSFPDGPYDLSTSEATPVGSPVISVVAVDVDQNPRLTYSIIGGNLNGTFFINPTSGDILITKPLDFETKTMYNLTVLVVDEGGRQGVTYVVVSIKDANDHGPVFLEDNYIFETVENVDIESVIGLVAAVDADPDAINSQLTYHIISANPTGAPFTINISTGVIQSTGELDREWQEEYTLSVEVRNVRAGADDITLSTPVSITILDLNDNTPTFVGGSNITRGFPENSEVDFPIYQATAGDLDAGENGRVTYSIVSGNLEDTFKIDPVTGALTLARQIHTLTLPIFEFTLVIEATDNGKPALASNITVNALVGDYNDNAPIFVRPTQSQELYLPENEPIGYLITYVLATDIDTGINSEITYSFLNEESSKLFYFLREVDGNVSLYANFTADRETRDQYMIVLLATDGGLPQGLQTPLDVTVIITDKNDEEPYFQRVEDNVAIVQTLNATEHVAVNTSAGLVTRAFDDDLAPNNNVYYYIVGGNTNGLFSINITTGEIVVTGDLDRETISSHSLLIKATNNASYVATGSYDIISDLTLKEVNIVIGDINDNGPRFQMVLYTAGVSLEAPINTEITCVKATDLDIGGASSAIVYSLDASVFTFEGKQDTMDSVFYIEPGTGCLRTKSTLGEVSAGGFFDLTVTATDVSAGISDSALVRVFVLENSQQVVVVVASDIDTVRELEAELIQMIADITGGIVIVDDISVFIDTNGNTVDGRTMILLHIIDPNTNMLMNTDVVLKLLDQNSASINILLQEYGVVDVYPLVSSAGGAGVGIIEAALLAFALLLFLGALIFIIILCCLQRKYLKKIHGNSAAVIYATRSDADVKATKTYQGSNPLWLESDGAFPDDWPDSISLLGGAGAGKEYEAQEASMDFFSDIRTEVVSDALVMTSMVSENSVRNHTGQTKASITNGISTSNGRISSGIAAGSSGGVRSVSSSMASAAVANSSNAIGASNALPNRLNHDGSVTAKLSSGDARQGGYTTSYGYSSVGFVDNDRGDERPSTSGSQRLTSQKAQEIREMLDEDDGEEYMYGNGTRMAAARAIYREQVEFENQLSPITEEDTTSSWSSWTRDSDRSGSRTLDRNRAAGRPVAKDYHDPMTSYTTTSSIEENFSHSVKGPAKTESSSYSRRANSKSYSGGGVSMVTLAEETPEMLDEDESDGSSEAGDGRTYTYNITAEAGDSSGDGAHSGYNSGQSGGFSYGNGAVGVDDETDGAMEEEHEVHRRSTKTTREYLEGGYGDFVDEESRL